MRIIYVDTSAEVILTDGTIRLGELLIGLMKFVSNSRDCGRFRSSNSKYHSREKRVDRIHEENCSIVPLILAINPVSAMESSPE
jgi:hypothetical protein